jgi:hypothetical protein
MGARAGLDAVVRRNIPSPYRDSNPHPSSPQSSAIPLSYPGSSADRNSTDIPYTSSTTQRTDLQFHTDAHTLIHTQQKYFIQLR